MDKDRIKGPANLVRKKSTSAFGKKLADAKLPAEGIADNAESVVQKIIEGDVLRDDFA